MIYDKRFQANMGLNRCNFIIVKIFCFYFSILNKCVHPSYNCSLSQTLAEQFGHFCFFKIGKDKGININHSLEFALVWDIGILKPVLISVWNWLKKLQVWVLKVWEHFQHDQWIQKYRSERRLNKTKEDKRFKDIMARINHAIIIHSKHMRVFDMVTVLK